jgi:hypothetical protein
MRRLIAMVFFSLLSFGAQAQTNPATGDQPDRRIVILAPQGIDPERDTIALNKMIEAMTQSFAKILGDTLRDGGYEVINVLDQNPKYTTQQKVAIYGVKNKTHRMIVLTLEAAKSESDTTLSLQAQYLDLDFVYDGEKPKGVTPSSNFTKSYLVHSNVTGGDDTKTGELVQDFLNYLTINARVPPLPH